MSTVGFPVPGPGFVADYGEGGGAGVHDHDGTYSAVAHDHDGTYSAVAHDHDGTYSAVAHDHDGTYAPAEMARTITVTSPYTLVAGDAGKIIDALFVTAGVVTVPPNSEVAFPAGTVINVLQAGVGQVTVTPGAGVTLSNANGLKTKAQWSVVSLWKRTTNTWVVYGDTAV